MPFKTYIPNTLPLSLNRQLERGEGFRPIIGRVSSELRYRCNTSCPAYAPHLYSFQFDNIVQDDGVQLASVFNNELSLDNSFLMFPFSKNHNHGHNTDMVSDRPPISLVPIDLARPIITRNTHGQIMVLWVRDPELTVQEVIDIV